MDDPVSSTASRSPARRGTLVVIAAAVVAAGLIGVGTYGLLHSPGTGHNTPGRPDRISSSAPTVSASPTPGALAAPVVSTNDPEEFARQVANAVFAWDTATRYSPSDYAQAIVNLGDPSGAETPGLAADLTGYLPNTAAWAQLRQYGTRQWLTIDTATVPGSWTQALQQGRAALLPGTGAYTITGTRHRAGMWEDKPVTTTERVSFTVFETCRPTYSSCRLLRLSQLDKPLP